METAEKVSITIPPEMMRLIRSEVERGRYASTSEAIRDALRLWQREREEHEARLEVIRGKLREALDDPSPRLTPEEVRQRLRAHHERRMAEHERGR